MKINVEGIVVIQKQEVLVTGFHFEGDTDDPRTMEQTIIDWATKQIREARFGETFTFPPKLYGLVSYCAEHDTYPAKGEPCWQCANPHIVEAGRFPLFRELEANIEDLEEILHAVTHGYNISTKHNGVVHHDHQTGRCKVYRRDTLADKVAAAKPEDTIIHCCDDVFGGKEVVFTKDETMDAIKKLWGRP